MAKEKDFAKELNNLITRYVNMGCDPQDIVDELTREANSVFGTITLRSISKRDAARRQIAPEGIAGQLTRLVVSVGSRNAYGTLRNWNIEAVHQRRRGRA